MEQNPPPYHWDWEQAVLNPEETTSYNPLEPIEWYNQRNPEFGFGSLILTRDGRGWDSPVSDLLNSSSSKSLKSASASLNKECKNSNIKADDFEVFLEGSSKRKEIVKNDTARASPPFETSAGSSEQLFLSLKLGKGMYNEDAYYGKAEASLSVMPPARQNRVKKYTSTYQTTLSSRCQVEGCNIDLSSAKEYHRKHRVCEIHSRSPKVIVAGLERRFCQQCSRFHNLLEFDEKKRSCRKRLSDHNFRRRKSHPKLASFNQGKMSSVYDARLQMSLSSDRLLPGYQRPTANFAWEGLCSSKHAQSCQMKPKYSIYGNGQQLAAGTEKPFTITHPHCNSNRGTASAVFKQGFKECRLSSSMSGHQDFNTALSLLSTNYCGLRESKNILAHDHKQSNHTSMSPTKTQAKIQSTHLASDHVKWCYEHNSSAS